MNHEEMCNCKNDACECAGEGSCGCNCGCHGGGFQRRFQTKTEQVKELESYLADLRLEVQAVEERLADLQK